MKHTKGPWFNYIAPHGTRHILPCSEPTLGTVQICTFNGSSYRKHDETEANAQLIAAAPDLLAAAIAALSIIQIERPDGSICADLIAAIRKATK
jgi:hypothetical protein